MEHGQRQPYVTRPQWFRGSRAFLVLSATVTFGIALLASLGTGCEKRSSTSVSEGGARVDLGACRDGDRDRQRYRANCLCCHQDTFGVAGSVAHDAGVALVKVRDRDGKIAEMYVNTYDNFFQHRRLTPPISAVIVFADGTERRMPEPAPHASCNGCHGETAPLLGTR